MSVLATVRNPELRLCDAASERFSITSMRDGATWRYARQIDRLGGFSFDHKIRVVIDGSPQFVFNWLLRIDGIVARILLAPRVMNAAIRTALESHADIVLVEHPQSVYRWSDLPVMIGGNLLFETGPSDACGKECYFVGGKPLDTQWVLATSGTTGDAKLVGHQFHAIARTAKADERHRGFRWGLAYDVARFAGLQVLVQAAVSDSILLDVDLEDSIQNQVDWLIEQRCDALSATPTRWRQMLMADRFGDLPLRQITLGGEIADERLLRSLIQRFPYARISHVYASTEGGVVFSVHDGKPGFPKSFLDAQDRPVHLAVDSDGTLWVRGPRYEILENALVKMDPLEREPEPGKLTSINQFDCLEDRCKPGFLTDESDHLPDLLVTQRDFRWINTGDKVEISGERVLFLGRVDGAINIGGSKVFPERIESIVRQVKGVESVLVRGKPSSIVGCLVEAFVTIEHSIPNVMSIVESIRAHCKANLALHEVPAFIHIVNELPINEAGKMSRAPFR